MTHKGILDIYAPSVIMFSSFKRIRIITFALLSSIFELLWPLSLNCMPHTHTHWWTIIGPKKISQKSEIFTVAEHINAEEANDVFIVKVQGNLLVDNFSAHSECSQHFISFLSILSRSAASSNFKRNTVSNDLKN